MSIRDDDEAAASSDNDNEANEASRNPLQTELVPLAQAPMQGQNDRVSVSLRHVNKRFEAIPCSSSKRAASDALRRLSLEVLEGETVVLLGPNGAGKSTAIAVMLGLVRPSSGQVHALGLALPSRAAELRARTGVCPQTAALFDELSVDDHLALAAGIRALPSRIARARGRGLVAQLGLSQASRAKPVGKLSGGQRRMLLVALALLSEPELVVCDEPTAGMVSWARRALCVWLFDLCVAVRTQDPEARRRTWELLHAASSRNANDQRATTVVITTHLLDEVRTTIKFASTHVPDPPPHPLQAEILANRIAVVVAGQVAACGSALELKREYGGEHRLTATVAVDETSATDKSRDVENSLLELVHRHTPDATLANSEVHAGAAEGSSATEEVIIVRLPLERDALNRDAVLAKICTDIDVARSEGNLAMLSNIGLEMPSLEAAFVRLLRGAEGQTRDESEHEEERMQHDASIFEEDDYQESISSDDEATITMLQTLALLRKEVWLLRADWTSALTMLLFEPMYIIVILFLSGASDSDDLAPVFTCDPESLASQSQVLGAWPGSRADLPSCARALAIRPDWRDERLGGQPRLAA